MAKVQEEVEDVPCGEDISVLGEGILDPDRLCESTEHLQANKGGPQ